MVLVGRERRAPRVLRLLLTRLIVIVVIVAISTVPIRLLPTLQLCNPLLHDAMERLLVSRDLGMLRVYLLSQPTLFRALGRKELPLLIDFHLQLSEFLVQVIKLTLQSGVLSLSLLDGLLILPLDAGEEGYVVTPCLDPLCQEVRVVLRWSWDLSVDRRLLELWRWLLLQWLLHRSQS